ncbi:hypothetical protein J6590_097823, partial [Homalodisca vitripennis]
NRERDGHFGLGCSSDFTTVDINAAVICKSGSLEFKTYPPHLLQQHLSVLLHYYCSNVR